MTNQETLMRAVRDLRLLLGLSQTEFGAKLGKSLATILRYETLRPPKGSVLAQLHEIAEALIHSLEAEFRKLTNEAEGTPKADQLGVRMRDARLLAWLFKNALRIEMGAPMLTLEEGNWVGALRDIRANMHLDPTLHRDLADGARALARGHAKVVGHLDGSQRVFGNPDEIRHESEELAALILSYERDYEQDQLKGTAVEGLGMEEKKSLTKSEMETL